MKIITYLLKRFWRSVQLIMLTRTKPKERRRESRKKSLLLKWSSGKNPIMPTKEINQYRAYLLRNHLLSFRFWARNRQVMLKIWMGLILLHISEIPAESDSIKLINYSSKLLIKFQACKNHFWLFLLPNQFDIKLLCFINSSFLSWFLVPFLFFLLSFDFESVLLKEWLLDFLLYFDSLFSFFKLLLWWKPVDSSPFHFNSSSLVIATSLLWSSFFVGK